MQAIKMFNNMLKSINSIDRAMRTTHNASTRLLSLPPELRNHIWSLTFDNTKFSPVTTKQCNPEFHLNPQAGTLKIGIYAWDYPSPKIALLPTESTQICHQIRQEVMSLFYANKVFFLVTGDPANPDVKASKEWIRNLDPTAVKYIRHIIVAETLPDAAVAEVLLSGGNDFVGAVEKAWKGSLIDLKERTIEAVWTDGLFMGAQNEIPTEQIVEYNKMEVEVLKRKLAFFRGDGLKGEMTAEGLLYLLEAVSSSGVVLSEAREARMRAKGAMEE